MVSWALRSIVNVRATWDGEAKVWTVEGSDVPGLAAEASTLDTLRHTVLVRIAELLEDRSESITVEFVATVRDRLDVTSVLR